MIYTCQICGRQYNTAKDCFDCEVHCRNDGRPRRVGYDMIVSWNNETKKLEVDSDVITDDEDIIDENAEVEMTGFDDTSSDMHDLRKVGVATFYEDYITYNRLPNLLESSKELFRDLVQHEIVASLKFVERSTWSKKRHFAQHLLYCELLNDLLNQLNNLDELFWNAALQARRYEDEYNG